MRNIEEQIERSIYLVRGQRVMLDEDLPRLYQVRTKALVQAIKRNIKRFPIDFMLQLTAEECSNLRSQIVTSSGKPGRRALPHAFTEHGVAEELAIGIAPERQQILAAAKRKGRFPLR